MKAIDLEEINFRPNLRILKNYIIVFERHLIKLFDCNGNFLDDIRFLNRSIINLEILNDNVIIVAFHYSIYIM